MTSKSPAVLSGSMFSGKSTLGQRLSMRQGYAVVSARQVLRQIAGSALGARQDLQAFGADLETSTNGKWLAEAADEVAIAVFPQPVVIDSARTAAQITAVRLSFEQMVHIHLEASDAVRSARFRLHTADLVERESFEDTLNHPIEQEALKLGESADVVIDTTALDSDETYRLAERALMY